MTAPVDAYLARLGVDAEPPSADALFRLHRAQVERVPYETLWIHLGEGWDIDVTESFRRVAVENRGGYCFHLNGAFSELLRTLGYRVERHVGGVGHLGGDWAIEMTNHLVLTVHGLPDDTNPGGDWYVDAGLGDALHEPLPLRAGTYDQPPFRLTLDETPGDVGEWRLTHDPRGGFARMYWRAAPAGMDEFAQRHRWLSTSADSGFVKVLTVQRRDATGVDVLRGLSLKRIGSAACESTIGSKHELIDTLNDLFNLQLDRSYDERLAALWDRTYAAHLRWEAAGRPYA
jgi:N-hydroxyarylamine O-acetyltransferase